MKVKTNPFRVALLAGALAVSVSEFANAQQVAWAWVDPVGAATTFTPSSAYQFNSFGGDITVTRLTPSSFRVSIPGAGTSPGAALHASAYQGSHTAVVHGWSPAGNDLNVTIDLYDASGGPANDEAFTVHYRHGGDATAFEGYVWANQASSGSYTPNPVYSWNGGRADPTITRSGVGTYAVRFPGLAATFGTENGHVQVSPYGLAMRRAKVVSWADAGPDMVANVRCYNAVGSLADSRFVLSYNQFAAPIPRGLGSGAHVWANDPAASLYAPSAPYTASNGAAGPSGAETIERLSTGRYRVNLPDLASWLSSTVQVTAYGSTNHFASIEAWTDDGCGGTDVYVNTFEPNGTPVDSRFTLLYLTSHPADQHAWAWVSPTGPLGATFTPSASYQYSSNGQTITVDRDPTFAHIFTVNIPGSGSSDGAIHASAYGGNHTAVVVAHWVSATSYRARIELFDATGAPANDAAFSVFRRGRGGLAEREAYVVALAASTPSYTPADAWNGDRGAALVTRTNVGRYTVHFPGLGVTAGELGHVQVTPYTNAILRRTSVVSWRHVLGDVDVFVECRDAAGAFTDTGFVLSYNEKAAPIPSSLGSGAHVWANQSTAANYTPAARYTDSNGTVGPANAENIQRIGLGHYSVRLPNLAPSQSTTAQVTAYGPGARYASIMSWGAWIPTGTIVTVRTYDAAGAPADSRFTLLYLSDDAAGTQATNTVTGPGCNGPTLSGITRPILCRDWQLELDNIPAGAVLGFLQLDFTNPNLTIGPNAPGCVVYTGGAASFLLLPPIPTPALSLALPSDPSFLGVTIHAQGGAFVSGLNPYSLAVSNGLRGVIGDL